MSTGLGECQGGFSEIADSFKPWHLLPGVLGSFFVFAGILGYRQLGPSITIATLVATQLITGLLADSFKPGSFAPKVDPMAIVGVILLVAGVLLIVRGKG